MEQNDKHESHIQIISVERIFVKNPVRTKIDQESLERLAESIDQHGLLTPINVFPVGDKFRIITGVRRFMAIRDVLKESKIECKVYEPMSEAEILGAQFAEDDQKENPSLEEISLAIKAIMISQGKSKEEIAKILCEPLERIEEILNLVN